MLSSPPDAPDNAAADGSVAALRAAVGALSRQDRRRLVGLLALMAIAGLLDGLGVGAALPLAAAILEPQGAASSPLARLLYDVARVLREAGGAALAALLLFLVFALKNAFAVLVVHLQTRFVLTSFAEVSSSLLGRYMRAPWREHARRSTADILRNVVDDTRDLYAGTLLSALIVGSHLFAGAAVLVVLLVLDWRMTVMSVVLSCGVAAGFYGLLHSRISALSHQRRAEKGRMNHWVHESLASLKEAKLGSRQAYFVDRYRSSVHRYARAQSLEHVARRTPRMLVETAAVGGLAAAVLIAQWRSAGAGAAGVPMLAALAVAISRLMPAVHGISSEMIRLRLGSSSLHALTDVDEADLEARPATPARLSFSSRLELERVRVRYPGSPRDALSEVSLSIGPGEALAIVGGSGAGKTTLGDVILSLITPDDGRVLVDGVEIAEVVSRWRASVAYVPQRVHLLDDTLRRNVAFGLPDEDIDDDDVWWALKRAGLEELARSLPGVLEERVGERGALVSGGQLQRIGIARALYRRPCLIVLDEATASLDGATERGVADRLFQLEERPALVVIAHRMSTARRCDRVALLEDGHLVRMGTFEELLGDVRFTRLLHGDEDITPTLREDASDALPVVREA